MSMFKKKAKLTFDNPSSTITEATLSDKLFYDGRFTGSQVSD